MSIILDQPDKICNQCGKVIPANVRLDRNGIIVEEQEKRKSLLICEQCARNAMPPNPPKQPKPKGPDPRQERSDVGSILIK